jgi:hypothetical protein
MRSDRAVIVTPDPRQGSTFDVVVCERQGESSHRVTVSAADLARFSGAGLEPGLCVEAAMAFLLDREPKESILSAFDIGIIRRYFPEFDEAFSAYLDRAQGSRAEAQDRQPREEL